ncbi:MAG: polyphosphate:AMP phosphotransferase [Candidatus Sumerlaeia bacterium]|nr:polyphosphate:AMP phosphotransferase [Candidatus Sumerlaeia bacterium]
MLETVDTNKKLEKSAYKEWFPRLKFELRELQQTAREAKLPIIIILEGWHLAGKSDSMRHLAEALDPRGFRVHTTFPPTEEERTDHWLQRFWERFPEKGRVVVFVRSWYYRVLHERVEGTMTDEQVTHAFQAINQTEQMLTADGAVVLKFWLHISRKEQKRRLKSAEKNPFDRYVVSESDWEAYRLYSEYERSVEEMLERTSTHGAQWIIVGSGDHRYRRLRIFQELCEGIVNGLNRQRLKKELAGVKKSTKEMSVPVLEEMPTILDKVDLTKTLDSETYDRKKVSLQLRLRRTHNESHNHGIPMVNVFEGWDAAGKGGAIRRLTATLDARYYRVIPIGKPTPEELNRHYLWRFWRHIPKDGVLTIFDRSWYGRVMVERIEGFCTEEEWRRAYQEINEFELQLFNAGVVINKFWLHISAEEQLARFESRAEDPHKSWKLTDEDWRNREKWDLYREAVDDMIKRTSTTYAPWTIVEGNCKRYARVKVIETVCQTLDKAIEGRKPLKKKGKKKK